jgi:hypothetical protein
MDQVAPTAGAREHDARAGGAAWPGARLFAERPTSASPPPVRNREFLSPHHELTCSVRDCSLASKVASPL